MNIYNYGSWVRIGSLLELRYIKNSDASKLPLFKTTGSRWAFCKEYFHNGSCVGFVNYARNGNYSDYVRAFFLGNTKLKFEIRCKKTGNTGLVTNVVRRKYTKTDAIFSVSGKRSLYSEKNYYIKGRRCDKEYFLKVKKRYFRMVKKNDPSALVRFTK